MCFLPVSYTHLDVYKRQPSLRIWRLCFRPQCVAGGRKHESAAYRRYVFGDYALGDSVSVSYTHLDVYKRQRLHIHKILNQQHLDVDGGRGRVDYR